MCDKEGDGSSKVKVEVEKRATEAWSWSATGAGLSKQVRSGVGGSGGSARTVELFRGGVQTGKRAVSVRELQHPIDRGSHRA